MRWPGRKPNGILYRISARDKHLCCTMRISPEIRSIVAMPDGTVYAFRAGRSIANTGDLQISGVSAPISVTVTAPSTSITVSDQAVQSGPEDKTKADTSKTGGSDRAGNGSVASPIVKYRE